MKVKKINIYSFDELSKEAQAKVCDKMRYINVEFNDWADPITEGAKEDLIALGYEDPHILFSGFGSQGDGACFTASVDIGAWLKAHKLKKKFPALFKEEENFTCSIAHNWRYYYATSTNVELTPYGDTSQEALKECDELQKLIEAEREKLGNKFYRLLSDYYDELTEDEAIRETILANEYEFLVNGESAPKV